MSEEKRKSNHYKKYTYGKNSIYNTQQLGLDRFFST